MRVVLLLLHNARTMQFRVDITIVMDVVLVLLCMCLLVFMIYLCVGVGGRPQNWYFNSAGFALKPISITWWTEYGLTVYLLTNSRLPIHPQPLCWSPSCSGRVATHGRRAQVWILGVTTHNLISTTRHREHGGTLEITTGRCFWRCSVLSTFFFLFFF